MVYVLRIFSQRRLLTESINEQFNDRSERLDDIAHFFHHVFISVWQNNFCILGGKLE